MNNPIVSKTRPWCIGRFVFQRPASSAITNAAYGYRSHALVTTEHITAEDFHDQVATRERELQTKQRVDLADFKRETGLPWLVEAYSPTPESRVFLYRMTTTDSVAMPYKSDGYAYLDGALLRTTGSIGQMGLDKAENIYKDMFRRFKARDNWDVPREAGFCVDSGLITGEAEYPEDVSQSFALLPGRPALLLIKMRDAVPQDQGHPLTKNMSDLRAQLNRMPGRYQILRQGKRQVAGMDAEEVLFKLRDGDVTVFRFYLLAQGDPSTLARPHTSIQMHLGAPPRATLPPEQATSPVDEAGALQTWDTLLDSLKLRPGAI
ncbi:T6SS immunity protein Tli4 family protein [Burkholderia sp. A1]|uniref:T6SS immunity protein Tli4 family protein n=1 Tax=Burkholderia sp. A1 TaxID=148446 RepID=UPI001F55CB66|nr:T6SS immunity protein Tli4 family protein [Burkholderia sp. A1]